MKIQWVTSYIQLILMPLFPLSPSSLFNEIKIKKLFFVFQ